MTYHPSSFQVSEFYLSVTRKYCFPTSFDYTVLYYIGLYNVDKMGNAFGSFDLLDDLFGRRLWIIIWTILHSWVASKSTGNQGSKGSGEFWCFENLRNQPEKSSQVNLDFSEHWGESPRIHGSINHHMFHWNCNKWEFQDPKMEVLYHIRPI